MLREKLKEEIDKLNEEQLKKLADYIALIQFQPKQVELSVPFWQKATPSERSEEFRKWVSQLPKNSPSHPIEPIFTTDEDR